MEGSTGPVRQYRPVSDAGLALRAGELGGRIRARHPCAARIRFLEGTQPTLTQVAPRVPWPMRATRAPSPAAAMAAIQDRTAWQTAAAVTGIIYRALGAATLLGGGLRMGALRLAVGGAFKPRPPRGR